MLLKEERDNSERGVVFKSDDGGFIHPYSFTESHLLHELMDFWDTTLKGQHFHKK